MVIWGDIMTEQDLQIFSENSVVPQTAISDITPIAVYTNYTKGIPTYIKYAGASAFLRLYTKANDLMQTATQITTIDLTNITDWNDSTDYAYTLAAGAAETDILIMDFDSIDERYIRVYIHLGYYITGNVYISDDNSTWTLIATASSSATVAVDINKFLKESFRYLKVTASNADTANARLLRIYTIQVFSTNADNATESSEVDETDRYIHEIQTFDEDVIIILDNGGKKCSYEIVNYPLPEIKKVIT